MTLSGRSNSEPQFPQLLSGDLFYLAGLLQGRNGTTRGMFHGSQADLGPNPGCVISFLQGIEQVTAPKSQFGFNEMVRVPNT